MTQVSVNFLAVGFSILYDNFLYAEIQATAKHSEKGPSLG
jgi:hypothetical protein